MLLHGLFVSAKAQGCGIGGLLLDELTRQARERRFAGIFVRAERFSTSYFEQKGFRPLRDGDHPGLQPANYPHRYLMDLSVGASEVNRILGGWRGPREERRGRHPDKQNKI